MVRLIAQVNLGVKKEVWVMVRLIAQVNLRGQKRRLGHGKINSSGHPMGSGRKVRS